MPTITGLPMTHRLRVFDALEPKFTPFKFVLCVELTLWIGQWGLGQPSKILHYGLPLLRHRHHSCDLGKSAMLSARLYNPCFHALWISGSGNYNIVRCRMHNTLLSKSKYYIQNNILRAGSSEHKKIPSMLMKRGWKYPLKHQEGGEGTP